MQQVKRGRTCEYPGRSCRCLMGQKQAMKEGRVNSPVSRLYGYGTSDAGELVIVLEQAEIVKQMFNRILAADSLRMIRDALNADSIPARGGGMEGSYGSWDYHQ